MASVKNKKSILTASTWISFAFLILACFGLSNCTFPTPPPYPTPIPCGDTDILIEAIKFANSDPTTLDIIELDAGCVYKLNTFYTDVPGNTGLPAIVSPIRILGHGATISRDPSAQDKFRIFHVGNFGDLSLTEMTIKGGYAHDPTHPTDVQRNSGGAIRNTNTLYLSLVTLEKNKADGVTGGIFNEGDLVIKSSTITGSEQDVNSFTMGGATAIHNYFGATATMVASTINGNGQIGNWNAITNSETATFTIENSTISDNGSRALNNDGDMNIYFTTIVGHAQGIWSVWYGIPKVQMKGVLFQNQIDCDFAAGVVIVNLFNMDSDGTCSVHYTVPAAAQQLGPLANNGGVTKTHALQPGSPAIEAVIGAIQRVCPVPEDQRGVSRPQNANCDIGAYEFEGVVAPSSSQDETPTPSQEAGEPDQPLRCDLFDGENAALTMFDIPSGTTDLSLFVEWPHPVPGLEEEIVGDTRPWEYSAFLGSTPAGKASYQGYSGRVYFDFKLPVAALGAALPLEVYVNECDEPIFSHPWVSIFDPDDTGEEPPEENECKPELPKEKCEALGWNYDKKKNECVCP